MQVFGNSVRFAVYAPPHALTFPEYLDLWLRAEALGYDASYLTDHYVTNWGEAGVKTPIFEGLTLLSAMAARTTTMRCGVNVVGNTFRNPAIVAKIATTIDHISNGRLELGLGAAHTEIEHDQYNIPFHTTGRRLRMLAEATSMIRSLLSQDVTNFQGKYYTLRDAVCEPKPIQNPIPIIIGGLGEQLTLRIVAEFADIWNVYSMLESEDYQRKLDLLSEYCQEIGRNPGDIRQSMIISAVVSETEQEAREQVSHRWFRPVGMLVVTPEQLVEFLLDRVRMGVSDFLFSTGSPIDWHSLDLIATKVAPIVRAEGSSMLNQLAR